MSKKFVPTPNAPNPAKFMKEMQTLIPLLKAKGIIPMNREEARAAGEKGTQAAALAAQVEHQRRMDIIGRRLDEYIKDLSPRAFRLVAATGWGWVIRAMGYRYDIQATNESVEGCPPVACTRIYVQRRWFPLFRLKTVKAERLIWEEPKKEQAKKPAKSRIITL